MKHTESSIDEVCLLINHVLVPFQFSLFDEHVQKRLKLIFVSFIFHSFIAWTLIVVNWIIENRH